MKLHAAGIALISLVLGGCSSIQRDTPIQVWDDMKHQPKFKAQSELDLAVFPDHRSNRLPPEGTVARGRLEEDTPFLVSMRPWTIQGCRPLSVSIQPAVLIRKGRITTQGAVRRNHLAWSSLWR